MTLVEEGRRFPTTSIVCPTSDTRASLPKGRAARELYWLSNALWRITWHNNSNHLLSPPAPQIKEQKQPGWVALAQALSGDCCQVSAGVLTPQGRTETTRPTSQEARSHGQQVATAKLVSLHVGSPQSHVSVLPTWQLASCREKGPRSQGRGCSAFYDLTLGITTVTATVLYRSHRPALIQCEKRTTWGMNTRHGAQWGHCRGCLPQRLTHQRSFLIWIGLFFGLSHFLTLCLCLSLSLSLPPLIVLSLSPSLSLPLSLVSPPFVFIFLPIFKDYNINLWKDKIFTDLTTSTKDGIEGKILMTRVSAGIKAIKEMPNPLPETRNDFILFWKRTSPTLFLHPAASTGRGQCLKEKQAKVRPAGHSWHGFANMKVWPSCLQLTLGESLPHDVWPPPLRLFYIQHGFCNFWNLLQMQFLKDS